MLLFPLGRYRWVFGSLHYCVPKSCFFRILAPELEWLRTYAELLSSIGTSLFFIKDQWAGNIWAYTKCHSLLLNTCHPSTWMPGTQSYLLIVSFSPLGGGYNDPTPLSDDLSLLQSVIDLCCKPWRIFPLAHNVLLVACVSTIISSWVHNRDCKELLLL